VAEPPYKFEEEEEGKEGREEEEEEAAPLPSILPLPLIIGWREYYLITFVLIFWQAKGKCLLTRA
jgi:hypothetical protein